MLFRCSPARPSRVPRAGLLSLPTREDRGDNGARPLWLRGRCAGQVCPVCSDIGPHGLVLSVPSLIAADQSVTFLRCQRCESKFVAGFQPPAYEAGATNEASLRFYVEQGAGLEFFARALFSAARPGAKRYLEIGCGFGFGLDMASRIFGWQTLGLDPGPLAAAGRDMLGVNIESVGLTQGAQLSGGPYDVIAAFEVIEHLADPHQVISDMLDNLSDSGTLVLSTPDARYLDMHPGGGMVLPVLSPGYHAVLFTAEALSETLRKARFRTVTVLQEGSTLFAVASRSAPSGGVPNFNQSRYHNYLRSRFHDTESGSPIHTGFGSRLLAFLVNQRNYHDALDVYSALESGMAAQFGLHLNDPLPIARDVLGKRLSFYEIPESYPFCLAGLLYHRGQIAAEFETRADLACSYFLAARFAAQSILRSLNDIGISDGEMGSLPDRAGAALRNLI